MGGRTGIAIQDEQAGELSRGIGGLLGDLFFGSKKSDLAVRMAPVTSIAPSWSAVYGENERPGG
ncbi:MAG: hypothetical protein U5Q44_02060 [Dehalococcoidia bacterium]|nr:hypothetical protein [Dehalococcoidia bacterium]